MPGLGTLVNSAAIVVGAVAGTLLRRGIPAAWKETILAAMGLCVTVIGMKMAQGSAHLVLVVVSLALGALVGEALDLDGRLTRFGQWLQRRLLGNRSAATGSSLGEAFVSASLLFCIGAMAIVGAIEDGLAGNHEILFAKASLDGVISVVLASTLGIGVALSAVSVLVYQGAITLLSFWMQQFLTEAVIGEISATGGVMILAIGLNLLGVTKIRLANLIPGLAVLVLLAEIVL
ncbi:MAG: DUF554 domain-containing protein [Succiniclasticum sp.]|jgi:uncharacterized membrane protein YqgA involved in biofilm formation|nr:DUF554 domain-containing protein [Succiniclasticum sp.]MCI6221972.1 DUF554 domain-containing protein [Selenomonadales bacterium]MDY2870647.1 DUF554 domain-containing protein [Succiniclasticum sp.]MDY6303237.1 DUF554 domain-containing protein [Succiniclasticum sp.]MDY6346618.1 DUF554 domain-containing protein [Succiniclasticum sp.]